MATKLVTLFIIFILCFFRCLQPSPADKKCTQEFDILKYRKEVIPIDSILINSSAPFIMNKDQFNTIFGKSKSVPAPDEPYGIQIKGESTEACFYHFIGRSIFISKGMFVYPLLLDLESTPVFLKYNSLELSNKTWISDIKDAFPLSTKIYKGNESNAFHGVIQIDSDYYNQGFGSWFLIFQSDRLAKISFFSPPVLPIINLPTPR